METIRSVSLEEEIAYHLAEIAVHLHKCGLNKSYRHVVKARDNLLLALDKKNLVVRRGEEQIKMDNRVFMLRGKNASVPLIRLLPDRENRKSKSAVA